MKFLPFLLVTLVFTSCFRKKSDSTLFIDYDTQKTINKDLNYIIFDASAYSGTYVGYADSTSPYSSGVLSNLKLLLKSKKVDKLNVSAFIKKTQANAEGNIAFKILDKTGTVLLNESISILKDNGAKVNEWSKIEGKITLPVNEKLYDAENAVYLFLYSVKDRILIDDLEISWE
jgi:hypothetical protein